MSTEYTLLKYNTETNSWDRIQGGVVASSPRRAVRDHRDLTEGEYVAVPSRSWKPLTVSVEQTTKVTIG